MSALKAHTDEDQDVRRRAQMNADLGHVVNDEGALALDGGGALTQTSDQQGNHDGQLRRLHSLP